jgi:ATP synthase protein I
MQQPDVLQAKRVLIVQLALTLILAVAALPLGISVALSVLIGAAVCLLANTIFAFWVFRQYRAQDPRSLAMRFYGAEAIKLSLVLGLFVVAFTTSDSLNIPALLVAYFAVQVLPAVFASRWDAPGIPIDKRER